MKVDSLEMWRAVKNATLFCREKTFNGGEAEIIATGDKVYITASDDFVTVMTWVPIEPVVMAKAYLPAKGLKELEKSLREREGQVDLDFSDAPKEAKEPEWWDGLGSIFNEIGNGKAVPVTSWELNPDRLTMLSRLEPKGEYPLSWMPFSLQRLIGAVQWVWGLKYGPHTTGIVVPLDRDEIDLQNKDAVLWRA